MTEVERVIERPEQQSIPEPELLGPDPLEDFAPTKPEETSFGHLPSRSEPPQGLTYEKRHSRRPDLRPEADAARSYNVPGFNWWFDRLIDIMLEEPHLSLKELAVRCNRSPQYISLVRNSDLFKARYALRREQFNQQQAAGLNRRLTRVAELGLDSLIDKLEKKAGVIKATEMADITNSALDRLGYAPKKEGGPAVNVNVQQNNANVAVPVARETLEKARESLRASQAKQIESKHSEDA